MNDLDVLKSLISEKINGDLSRFEELWSSSADFDALIRNLITTKKSLSDGWYLIEENGFYDVYYQEKAVTCWGKWRFERYHDAVKYVLGCDYGLKIPVHTPDCR